MHCWIAILIVGTFSISAAEKPLGRIAFGSCLKQLNPAPIWQSIVAAEPNLFLFLGDAIYADTRDPSELRQKWSVLGSSPGYQALLASCPVMATWDDHDYGWNDVGNEFEIKRESQQIFLDFFGEPADSSRRRQAGIYDARTFGPAAQRVQIILLDTRYHRSALLKGPNLDERGEGRDGTCLPLDAPDATLLGETQWAWLESQLRQPAEVRLIASSIQLISNEHRFEKWGNLPRERERFLQLLQATRAQGVIVLSGDRHTAEISRLNANLGYPLYDVTSSGLNQIHPWRNELNPHRIGALYFEENFGLITIDWTQPDPVLRLQIRNLAGRVVLQIRHRLSELRSR